ncbi:Murein DD-endopeptidase MepM and murein hydrolase activator NlpD, contain LysM domain [Rhodoblastus acidophilus]|uniref:Murein DD-endopeptidase MepM and murein hydrolase activator NlpD, contain LysM domain n=1 Tax=Rhodoblastus acidophilus TaxID=1074 RepID=A0A212SBS9_RHOAC|nr:M23 family metallopeptidase [Rhodoblastus acidophilus]SNB82801.1 Murein DD-endopeptidase MepM and murein hydrolase activator NlpD, contain LysM domain [Rhodoblastus acidophilus]
MATSVNFVAFRSSVSRRALLAASGSAEPPLDPRGEKRIAGSARRVSLRWLAGSGLTGLIGAGLLGGAIYAAFDREANFAEAPTRAQLNRRDQGEGEKVNPAKGDRLIKAIDIVAAKQTFKTPTAIRVGDREVIKNRTFTRVSTTLTLSDTGLSADVPEFNPLKLLSDSSNPAPEAPDDAPGPDVAEVGFTATELSPTQFGVANGTLSLDEVRAQVDETIKHSQTDGSKASPTLPSQLLLMKTSRASFDPNAGLAYATPGNINVSSPFSSIEVRMVPENVTLAPRTTNPVGDAESTRAAKDKLVVIRRGETLDDVLTAAGVQKTTVAAVKDAFNGRRAADAVAEGRRIKLSFAETENASVPQLARLTVYDGERVQALIALSDSGRYLLLENSQATSGKTASRKSQSDDDSDGDDSDDGMRLYNSLYETALKQEIPKPIIDQMIRTFANDVDFQRPVAAGDSIDAFFDNGDDGDHADLLYASVTARGETYKYYRFQSPDDQGVDYFDPSGKSTRKFLVRKPIATGELRSGFGMRFHPILHYSRPHNGVDWAAPIGTPIFAAGNGTVIKAGWDSGYGRRVEIEHNNGYVTTYNHMSAFARGLHDGDRVKQGQIVGYLGASGLATGPHLHYEVIVNGHFVDPLRVKLARTRQFEGKLLGDFKKERDRIDGLMAKAPNSSQVAGK